MRNSSFERCMFTLITLRCFHMFFFSLYLFQLFCVNLFFFFALWFFFSVWIFTSVCGFFSSNLNYRFLFFFQRNSNGWNFFFCSHRSLTGCWNNDSYRRNSNWNNNRLMTFVAIRITKYCWFQYDFNALIVIRTFKLCFRFLKVFVVQLDCVNFPHEIKFVLLRIHFRP